MGAVARVPHFEECLGSTPLLQDRLTLEQRRRQQGIRYINKQRRKEGRKEEEWVIKFKAGRKDGWMKGNKKETKKYSE
jgi:hypothetical protein